MVRPGRGRRKRIRPAIHRRSVDSRPAGERGRSDPVSRAPVSRALELASSATERTTAVTDALLALTVSGGLVRVRRVAPASWRRAVWLAALASFAASALLGTVVHGLALAPK